ncbi:MAG: septation ring formation regulator EzrA [Clostridium sp.]|nr:septation ring formation regulator EzrA [Clostridium sp.]MCM1444155.1 septation ring formation regulator EzrA [Candidatus Amulumruptor caecigallinarius]
MDSILLILITVFLVSMILVAIVLNVMQSRKNSKIKKQIDKLEVEKNEINSMPIVPELSKLDSFLKNDKFEEMYNDWKSRLNDIKENQLPKITDMLVESDFVLNQKDYRGALLKIAKLEIELCKVKTSSTELLNEIKEITGSEEKNRAIITNLKSKYRELYKKFTETEPEFGDIGKSVHLQFEKISKSFEAFEIAMENNEYIEVTKIIESIDKLLNHMETVIEEIPAIVIMATNVLPNKINDLKIEYDKMVKNGYPLDYLNVEYNIEEAYKKIQEIMDRTKVLNLEDGLFELKVLLEYFDSIFNDFEKEKIDCNNYDETNKKFRVKLSKLDELIKDIFNQINDIKNVYHLSDEDIKLLEESRKDVEKLKEDYKTLMEHSRKNTFAFSKLTKEIDNLFIKLIMIEDRVDNTLDVIGGMREDEARARQQLDEIKSILKDSKSKIREYNLPVIPKTYFVELKEAQAAIKEIIKELDKKPITIETLNTRVDTARDLVLKLFTKSKEMIKTAMFAEMAIVYGNRYRSSVEDLDKCLSTSEALFFKGEYQKSLELSINFLNRIEHGIYDKLLKLYNV